MLLTVDRRKKRASEVQTDDIDPRLPRRNPSPLMRAEGAAKMGDGHCYCGHPEIEPVHARALEKRSVWVGDHVGPSPTPYPCRQTS